MSDAIRLSLQKAESCFSAAHFLSSDFGKCHRLHGHLYTVTVAIIGSLNEEKGVLLDFRELKELVREQVAPLDHRILLAENSPSSIISKEEDGYSVRVCEKEYFFPLEDVVLLPIPATTCEYLACYLRAELSKKIPNYEIQVSLEETPGSSISTEQTSPNAVQ